MRLWTLSSARCARSSSPCRRATVSSSTPVFEHGYETLKRATNGFRNLTPETAIDAVYQAPIVLVVLRTMLGFTPPEWAEVTTRQSDVPVTQNAVRSLDRAVRLVPSKRLKATGGATDRRLRALVTTACELLQEGAPDGPVELLHRLDKAIRKAAWRASSL